MGGVRVQEWAKYQAKHTREIGAFLEGGTYRGHFNPEETILLEMIPEGITELSERLD